MLGVVAMSSQVTVTHDQALLYWKQLNACLLVGSSELIPYLCFAYAFSFCFIYQTLFTLFLPF